MKIHVLLFFCALFALAGCTALQAPSKRSTASSTATDFFNPQANSAYYEFSSSPLDTPSVLEETQDTSAQEPGEDEDFTAENIAGAYGTYGDVVVTVATRKFKLGPSATRKEMGLFQRALDSAYTVALKQYRPSGFTYAMSSVGAVNPLSDIEVACKLSELSANQMGQSTCNTFFKTIAAQYLKLQQEAR